MPTWERTATFTRQWKRLTAAERAAFLAAVGKLIAVHKTGHPNNGLRIKSYQGAPGVLELRWADDGRALFAYGPDLPGHPGPHVIWLEIGTHDIFK